MKILAITRTTAMLLCSAALSAGPMIAQAPAGPPAGQMAGRGGMQGQQMLDMMTKELSLTPDQVTQVKAISADQQKQTTALREDATIAQDEKRPKMMEIRQASQARIKALLTDEQKPKYDALVARMRERMQNQGGATAPPPPPPPAQ